MNNLQNYVEEELLEFAELREELSTSDLQAIASAVASKIISKVKESNVNS